MEDVQVVSLSPMRVASFLAFSSQPELDAWEKLKEWASPRGLMGDWVRHPIYGFNNPSPTAGQVNYGYELWIVIEDDIEPDGGFQVKEFAGGLYAVGRHFWSGSSGEDVPGSWMALNAWLESSPYEMGCHQWLERSFDDPQGQGIDLFLPITIKR